MNQSFFTTKTRNSENTKFVFIFFVFSSFRAFVINLYLSFLLSLEFRCVPLNLSGLGSLRQLGKKQDPGRDLYSRQYKSQNKTNFGSGDNTGRRIPVSDGQIDDKRCRKDRKPIKYKRNRCKQQGNGIITGTVIFKILDFPIDLGFFKAGRTQMLTVERNITQGAKEPTAGATRHHRFFPGMIEAPGLFVHLHRGTGSAHGQGAFERRINIRPYPAVANTTGNQ